ncbi:MAG: hypothetical protein LBB13_01770, partial [Rickettsiales bacterium]|nr:hypothetical protein [Rickettsiales bacterium]
MAEKRSEFLYISYQKRLINLFGSAVDGYLEEERKAFEQLLLQYGAGVLSEEEKQQALFNVLVEKYNIESSLKETIDIIWSSRNIEPRGDIKDDDLIFETDLHGDMRAFLNTLLESGAVQFVEKEDPLIFYNPEQLSEEKNKYNLEELEGLMVRDPEKHRELMKKLQPLANVKPTKRYSQYVNCGDFLDRGKQTEQMIHLINYLDEQCKKNGIEPAKLTEGNHELLYIDDMNEGISKNAGNCIYGFYENIREKVFSTEKIKSMKKAVEKAIANKTLSLAYSKGTTIFSHTVIVKSKVLELANALKMLYEERKNKADNEPPEENEVAMLANKFEELGIKINQNQIFNENDTEKLAEGLNQFIEIRYKLFGNIKIKEGVLYENSTAAEKKIFSLMNSFSSDGITWNRIGNVQYSDQIPGIKYIVGHDIFPDMKDIGPAALVEVSGPNGPRTEIKFDDEEGKIIPADSCRSSGCYDHPVTKAKYGVVNSKSLADANFPQIRTISREITKEECELAAKRNYDTYLLEISKGGTEKDKKIRMETIEKRKHEDREKREKEDRKRKEEEMGRKKEREDRKRKEEEERRKIEEEKKRKEEEERRKIEEEKKRKEEEERRKI